MKMKPMLAAMLIVTSLNVSAKQFGDFIYMINSYDTNTVTIIGYTGTGGTVIIPSVIDSKSASIGDNAFEGSTNLTSVTIGNGVTSIGHYAFKSCARLTSVTIGNGVTSIGGHAFAFCYSLTSAYFQGNAPDRAYADIFYYSACERVYYRLGSSGWGATYSGRMTVPWNPLIQTGDGNFGIQTSVFGFNITTSVGGWVVVETCTNLTGDVWIPIYTNSMHGAPIYFSDPDWISHPSRYYRLNMP